MKKLFTLISILALLMLSGVFAADGVANVVSITNGVGFAGTTISVTVALSNALAGSDPIPSLTLAGTALTFGSNTITKPADPTSITNLAYGTNQDAVFRFIIPAGQVPGKYEGKFNVTYTINSVTSQIVDQPYSVTITPPAGEVSVPTTIPTSTTVNPGTAVQVTATTLSNKIRYSNPITLTVSSTDLTTASGLTLTKPADITISNLAYGTDQPAVFTINVPAGQLPGTYTGRLTATEVGNTGNTAYRDFSVVVNSVPALSFVSTPDLTFQSSSSGKTLEKTFTIKNTGNVVLNNLVVNHTISSLKDSNGNAITLTFSSPTIASLAIGATADIKATITIPSGILVQNFNGDVNVKADGLNAITSPISIKILPLSCSNTISSNMDVTIDTPSSSDNYEPGETINVNAIVHNRISSDRRFIVEAYLYNVDKSKKVSSYKSGDKNIDGNDELSFRFTLKMDNNLNDGDSYKIFVKAYERSNEENVCNQFNIAIDLDVPEDKVSIDSFSISPTTLSCGESSESLIQLTNLGQNDENVKVKLINNYLEIAGEQTVTLKSERNENTANVRIPFKIAKNIKDGVYKVIAEITYAGLPETKEQTITVKGCQAAAPPVAQSPPPQQNNQESLPVTPSTKQNKDIFELFNSAIETPTSFWLIADVLLVVGIFALLVGIFRTTGRRH